jgi:hypothetical protein
MALTSFNTKIHEFALQQSSWAAQLNPVLANPIVNGILLTNIVLKSGDNIISHKLDRKLQGWFITRLRASALIYDKQDSEERPTQFLKLNSNANVTVDIFVF